MHYGVRLLDGDKLGLVYFPRSASWLTLIRRWSGETVHSLTALLVFDVAQIVDFASLNACFLPCLTAGGSFRVLAIIQLALWNAPGRFAIVVARRVYQKHLEASLRVPEQ